MISEPKSGCDVLCEADFDSKRDIRVYSLRRKRFHPGWVITSDGAPSAEVLDWDGVTAFFKNIRAANMETSEV